MRLGGLTAAVAPMRSADLTCEGSSRIGSYCVLRHQSLASDAAEVFYPRPRRSKYASRPGRS